MARAAQGALHAPLPERQARTQPRRCPRDQVRACVRRTLLRGTNTIVPPLGAAAATDALLLILFVDTTPLLLLYSRTHRQHFTPGETFVPKPYVFPSDDDCVALICAEIPRDAAQVVHRVGAELIDLLPRRTDGGAVGYVNELELMHITLFHTSHPDELAPNAKARRSADIAQLTAMLERFGSFEIKPVRVLLASSGAVIMLFECLNTDSSASTAARSFVNANREFSVDHLRKAAKETFEHVPKSTGARTIVHSTLGRVLDPDVSQDALERVYAQCDAITARFAQEPYVFRINKLWYVEETHHFSPQGPKTVLALQ